MKHAISNTKINTATLPATDRLTLRLNKPFVIQTTIPFAVVTAANRARVVPPQSVPKRRRRWVTTKFVRSIIRKRNTAMVEADPISKRTVPTSSM